MQLPELPLTPTALRHCCGAQRLGVYRFQRQVPKRDKCSTSIHIGLYNWGNVSLANRAQ
jgi:hypothetical protein